MADERTESAKNNADSPIVAAVARAKFEPQQINNEELAKEVRNDIGNSRRLIARHGSDLSWVDEHGWHCWDGRRWRRDDGQHQALMRAHRTAESIRDEAFTLSDESDDGKKASPRSQLMAWSIATGNRSRSEAMLAAATPYLRQPFEIFDADPWALNLQNGTIRLNEAEGDVHLYEADRGDRITKCANVAFDRKADAPRWRQFVRDILPEDDVAVFVQKALGYCLSGDTSDQRVLIFEGKGANGKSTLLEVVARILGDYAATTPVEMFLHKDNKSSSGPSPDVARLPGVRLVRASEPEPGSRLSESMLKQWTGGEQMIARHLHRDFFEFSPSGKLILSVNIRPVLVGKDHGTRRRLIMVPFTQTFTAGGGAQKRGNTLVDELMAEAPGILNWLIDGFRLWWEDGFQVPQPIKDATEAYFAEMDPVGSFILECCVTSNNKEIKVSATELFSVYQRWCKANNEDEKTLTSFGRRLNDLGFKKSSAGGLVYRCGLEIRDEWQPNRGSDDD